MKSIIDRSLLESELADAKAQRDAAQQSFNQGQATIQQGQQISSEAQQKLLVCAGSIQALEALLKKFPEPTDNKETPAS